METILTIKYKWSDYQVNHDIETALESILPHMVDSVLMTFEIEGEGEE